MEAACRSDGVEDLVQSWASLSSAREIIAVSEMGKQTWKNLIDLCPDIEERIAIAYIGDISNFEFMSNKVVRVAKRIGKPVAPLWVAVIYDIRKQLLSSSSPLIRVPIVPGVALMRDEGRYDVIYGPGVTSLLIMSIIAQLYDDYALVERDALIQVEVGSHITLKVLSPSALYRLFYVILATPSSDTYSAYGEDKGNRWHAAKRLSKTEKKKTSWLHNK